MTDFVKKDVVCSGIDDNYTWPLLVALYGASKHKSRDFTVKIGYIANTLSESNQEIISKFCDQVGIDVQLKEFAFDYQVKTSNLPIQAYIRLLWLDILDETFLWLDADTLPLPNWQSIFDTRLDDQSNVVIRAVIDSDIVQTRLPQFPHNMAYQRGGEKYFNSGVFLANSKLWKKNNFHSEWPKVAAKHQELGFLHHDQDVLNYLAFQNSAVLDPSFNRLVMQGSFIDQRILHFTGQPKPWHFDEEAKTYFSSIELLKETQGTGAFGGVNWFFEYQNYWRHEKALVEEFSDDIDLCTELTNSYLGSRKSLLDTKDKIKNSLLSIVGRKWF